MASGALDIAGEKEKENFNYSTYSLHRLSLSLSQHN